MVTFPFSASVECGANLHATDTWLMDLPPATFNQFAAGALHGVKLLENQVMWIPYGWAAMMVNVAQDRGTPKTLVTPYLIATLALQYSSIGMMVNFNLDILKASSDKGCKLWDEHGPGLSEWLTGLLTHPTDSPAIQDKPLEPANLGQPALLDGNVEDGLEEEPSYGQPNL